MSSDFPTHSEIGEENIRQFLRRRNEEYLLYGRYPVQHQKESDNNASGVLLR